MPANFDYLRIHIIEPEQQYPVDLTHPWVWHTVINALQGVIKDREGTGFRFGRNAPYSVAAKTGTAQVFSTRHFNNFANNQVPEYLRDHSLFIAFAPVNHPKIAIAVIVENSNVAANVARKVLDYYLLHSRR